MFSSEALLAAKQRQRPTCTVVTLATGARFRLIRQADGSETLQADDALGRSDGFVADTKPDAAVCKVIDGLFIGSQDASRNLDELRANRVTHILNAAAGIVPNAYPEEFEYLALDILDIPEFNIGQAFEKSWDFIHRAIQQQPQQQRGSGGVLVHCNAGISRSGALVISYLMRFHGMDYDTAYNVTKLARPAVLPNGGFQQALRRLEARLRENKK